MKLVTKTIEKQLQKYPLYSQDGNGDSAKVIAKFFSPIGAATWLVTEGEKQKDGDWLFFGWVTLGHGWECGYFSLSQLKSVRLPYGLSVERDIYTKMATVGQMIA